MEQIFMGLIVLTIVLDIKRKQAFVFRKIYAKRHDNLMLMTQTKRLLRQNLGLLKRRQQDRNEQRNDGDNHKQFDQGKTLPHGSPLNQHERDVTGSL